jgi:U3 small nucleolar RNA-associated protein 14
MMVVGNQKGSIYSRIWCAYEAFLAYSWNKLIFTAKAPEPHFWKHIIRTGFVSMLGQGTMAVLVLQEPFVMMLTQELNKLMWDSNEVERIFKAWLADAEENPWTATAGADAATPASSSTVAVDANNAKRKGAAASAEPTSKRKRRRGVKDAVTDEADDAEAEPVASTSERLNLLDADANAAREQRDLVRATFVEGTQAEDFDQEREDKMLEEEEKSKPTELVGWGSWAGDGVKARPAPKKGKGAGKGKAKGKGTSQHSTPKPSHVQVYEGDAAVKAQSKYFVSGVPFPFKSPQQYDQDMRMPTGPEWNTLSGHLQRVKPKVFVKTGAIVAPLQYVKHLDPEQRESAINTWASAKQPKRLKARF